MPVQIPAIKFKGRFIETRSGKFGILLSKSKPINGQLPFILTDADFKPILDSKRQPQKMLVRPENIRHSHGWAD